MAIREQVFPRTLTPKVFTPDESGKCTLCGLPEYYHDSTKPIIAVFEEPTDKCERCFYPYAYHVESGSTPEQRRVALPNAIEGHEVTHFGKIGIGCERFEARTHWLYDHDASIKVCRQFVISYEGAVLETREENGYDDSDWYALVWDGTAVQKEYYMTTRGGGTDHNSATVDATDEVKAAAQAWLADRYYERLIAMRENARVEMAYEARQPEKGKRVRVARGRKVEHGVEGTVFWLGEDNWGKARLGIRTDEGETIWIAAANVDVVDPEDYLLPDSAFASDEQLRVKADEQRGRLPWYSGTMVLPGFLRVSNETRFLVMVGEDA